MNIARIIYDWPPPWGGLAPAPYEMSKAQVKLGHKLTIFCGRWPRAGALESIKGVELLPIWRAPLKGTISLTSCVILFFKYYSWRKKNTPDIIHSHGHFGMWVYCYRNLLDKFFPWAEELTSPLVVHFHNTVAGRKQKLKNKNTPISFVTKFLDWPMAEFSDRMAIKTASAYIFVSEELKQEAIKYYKADPQKCFVVESGVNTSEFKYVSPEEKTKSRAELKLEHDDKVLLYVGVLSERKNPHLLLEALSMLPHEYKLLLVGEGSGDYKEKLEQLIRDKQLADRLVRVGYTPYPQIPIAYQVADLFLLPSSWEGMPKVALEALACGVPVLGAGFKIEGDISGVEYLSELTAEELCIKIKKIFTHKPTVDVYHIGLRFSWDTKAQEVEKVYDFIKKTYRK